MSKKQINNRLDKLFDDIKEEEQKTLEKTPATSTEATSKHDGAKKASEASLALTVPIGAEESIVGAQSSMSLPIRLDEESWMSLAFYDDDMGREWHEEEKLLAEQVVDQLSLALENARLFQETERRNAELNVLNEIISAASQSLELEIALKDVLDKTLAFLGIQSGLISMVNPQSGVLELKVWHALPNKLVKGFQKKGMGETLCGHVYHTEKPLFLGNLRIEESPVNITPLLENGLFGYAGVPLSARDKIVGTLCMFHNEPLDIPDENLSLLLSIGRQVGFAIENARLFQETQQRTEELALVNKVVTEVSRSLNLKKSLGIIAKEIAGITSALHVGIALLNNEKTHLVLTADYPQNDEDLGMRVSLENNVTTNEVLEKHIPLSVQDIQNNPLMSGIKDVMKQRGTESLAIFPLLSGDNAIGTVGVDFAEPFATLSEDQISLIQTILLQASTAIETARLFDETQKLQLGLEESSNVVFITDIHGTITYANPSFKNTYGFSLDEVLGQNPRILKSGIAKKEDYKLLWNTLLNKETFTAEIINKTKDGRLLSVKVNNNAILDEEGEIVGFLSVQEDITERKNAEKVLQRQNEYMTAASEVGRLVTSTLDMDILFRRAVNLLCEHFGYYHASIFIIEEAGFNAVIQESTGDAGKEMKERQHALEVGSKSVVGTATGSGEPFIVNNVLDNPNHRPNPLLPETRAEAAIPLKIGRRIIGALDLQATEVDAFTPEDIAVLQMLADQFATAIDNARSYKLAQDAFTEMREIDKLKSQFLANMSHELRTPLNSIIGFSRVILKGIDGPVTDLQQQDLSAIYNSGQHLLGLINDILDLSKIEAGKMELTFDEVDITKLIKSVMSTVVGLIKDKPVRLVEDLEEDLPIVKADSMRVRQVLINLFSNASKFTDEGTITVKAEREGNYVRIGIKDSGPGISEEDQQKLFKAFSQVDASATRATGGTGLGLSICRELVTMHDGIIDVESEMGKGSTFFFTLPIFYPDVADEPEAEIGETESDAPIILSIDDDPQVIQLYERYLNAQGYHVVPLLEPKQAVKRAKELKPHAITLDIMMPGYDGWQVLQDLKSNAETQNIPIIVCSIVEDTEKGYALGATDYLLKPIIEDDLLGALNRLDSGGMIREVLVIDDDESDLRLIEKLLGETSKFEPTLAQGGLAGWNRMQSAPPQAVILDLFMPELDGFEIIERMQENPELKDIPVIIVSGGDLTSTQKEKLTELNHYLVQKGTLDSDGLLEILERTLNQLNSTK